MQTLPFAILLSKTYLSFYKIEWYASQCNGTITPANQRDYGMSSLASLVYYDAFYFTFQRRQYHTPYLYLVQW